jgi:hypothetical protein
MMRLARIESPTVKVHCPPRPMKSPGWLSKKIAVRPCSASQASPISSPSASDCVGFADAGQLSAMSIAPSPSVSTMPMALLIRTTPISADEADP